MNKTDKSPRLVAFIAWAVWEEDSAMQTSKLWCGGEERDGPEGQADGFFKPDLQAPQPFQPRS